MLTQLLQISESALFPSAHSLLLELFFYVKDLQLTLISMVYGNVIRCHNTNTKRTVLSLAIYLCIVAAMKQEKPKLNYKSKPTL